MADQNPPDILGPVKIIPSMAAFDKDLNPEFHWRSIHKTFTDRDFVFLLIRQRFLPTTRRTFSRRSAVPEFFSMPPRQPAPGQTHHRSIFLKITMNNFFP